MTKGVLFGLLLYIVGWETFALLTGKVETFTGAIRDIASSWPPFVLIVTLLGALLWWHFFARGRW